jgi:hypothetical protein
LRKVDAIPTEAGSPTGALVYSGALNCGYFRILGANRYPGLRAQVYPKSFEVFAKELQVANPEPEGGLANPAVPSWSIISAPPDVLAAKVNQFRCTDVVPDERERVP